MSAIPAFCKESLKNDKTSLIQTRLADYEVKEIFECNYKRALCLCVSRFESFRRLLYHLVNNLLLALEERSDVGVVVLAELHEGVCKSAEVVDEHRVEYAVVDDNVEHISAFRVTGVLCLKGCFDVFGNEGVV